MTQRATVPRNLFLLCLLLGGCVERKLTITSEPSGALVYMNDKELGRTPIETDFVYYGNYDVQVRKEGYLTYSKPQHINPPWWQYPPIDLAAEFMPWHPTDRKALKFTLTPRPTVETPAETLIARAMVLKPQIEATRVPSTAPAATQPGATTGAATKNTTKP